MRVAVNTCRAWLARVRRGADGHPGNFPLLMLVGLGTAAGGLQGVGIMLLIFGPMWLYGCLSRPTEQ